MSDLWQALINGATIMAAAALALLIVDGPSARNLAISVILGVLAFVVTFVRSQR